jgi:tRNA G18 (ribose-2'-O)-methylase SpoU
MRGYFAIGIERTKTEMNVGTLWRSAHLLGAAYVFTIGRRYSRQASDTTRAWKSIPLFHYGTFDEMYSNMPHDCRLIGVELDPNAKALPSFVHPERCIYLLGAEDHGLTKATLARCHALVQLPGFASMNVSAAGTCVMYDRFAKSQRAA